MDKKFTMAQDHSSQRPKSLAKTAQNLRYGHKTAAPEQGEINRKYPAVRSWFKTAEVLDLVAGRQGFEPWERSHVQRFSSP
jgi:hypothetical protein